MQATDVKSVCIYCASSNKIDEKFFEAARQVGTSLAQHHITLRYGGGNTGLMGAVAKAVLDNGGQVIGIIPKFMWDNKWGSEDLTQMIIVDTMHERKQTMIENVDAVIALPGGVGTLEELLEVITWKQLGLFNKPILIVNTDGYYDPLIQMFNRAAQEKFMLEDHLSMFTVINGPITRDTIIEAIVEKSDKWADDSVTILNQLL
jgi:uncharacterized protein (TIGR00730 family)